MSPHAWKLKLEATDKIVTRTNTVMKWTFTVWF